MTDPETWTSSDIALIHAKYRRREWAEWAETNTTDIDGLRSFEFQSSILAYQAAKAGMGIAMGQIPLLQEELRTGALVQPFKKPVSTGSSFWVTRPSVASASLVTKALIDWLLREAGQSPEFNKKGGCSSLGR